MRDVDALVVNFPESALREANARLAQLPRRFDAFEVAQLYAVVSEAHANLNRADLATGAIVHAQALLERLSRSDSIDRIRLRLELLRTELDSVTTNAVASGRALDGILARLPKESIERACALSQRAIAYDFNNEPDRAVAAALAAHSLADTHGWDNARIESAYTLAVNFRRAGLYEQAQKMIDEAISLETSRGLNRSLSSALYERGQLMVAWGRYAEARAALFESRAIATANGDRLGAAAANIPLCLAQIDEHDWPAAATICNQGGDELLVGQRQDLAALLTSYQARLDLAMHHPAAALFKLNKVLSLPVHRLLPVQESQFYRDRGQALGKLGRFQEAFSDLVRAQTLDSESGIERRHRQVAVLSALLESEKLRADNRLLEENLKNQQQELAHHKKLRLWWASTAVMSMLGCALIGNLFVLGKRQNRRLRQYEIILSRAGGLTPHAMLVLDKNRCVCFANRCLLGKGGAPVIDAPLANVVPGFLLEEITVAIDKAFATTSFVSLDVALHDADGSNRYYELLILPAVVGGKAIGVTLQSIDVTESRNLERQFLDGASRERRQFGDNLHEGLAQELAGIMLMLGNLSGVVKRGLPEARQLVTEISEQIARSIGSARQMAQDLAPVMIERGSLPDAVQKLTESASRKLGISMSCDCRIEGCSTSDLAADHIYQFCREAVIDATMSKDCQWVRIEMTVTGASLIIRINDSRRRKQTGVETDGLRTKMLVFRARLLGGALSFDSTPANESSVTLKIPLSQLQEEAAADTKRRPKDVFEWTVAGAEKCPILGSTDDLTFPQ